MDDLFNIDVVKEFMISHGGKAKNHELVTHFKNYLSDPNHKVANRQKFKTFVNTLATVKLDENGEKVLVLKKKYRDEDPPSACSTPVQHLPKLEAPKAKLKDTFPLRQPSEREEDSEDNSNTGQSDSLLSSIQKELSKPKEETESFTPKPDYEDSSEEPKPDYDKTEQTDKPSVNEPEPDYETTSKNDDSEVFIDDSMEQEKSITESKDVVEVPGPTDFKDLAKKFETKPDETTPSSKVEEDIKPEVISVNSQSKPEAGESEDLESTVNIKDRVKHLNKMSSSASILGSPAHGRKAYKKNESEEGGQGMVHLNDIEREWLIISAKANYQDMARMLSKNPQVAKRKDFTNGYTALHWAAKHGNVEIVKMLCGTTGVQINDISHGGYTPLHLAAMQGHEEVIEILVQVYGADANLRDHSGKKPKQYLRNAASANIQQLLQVRKNSQSIAPSFRRSGSYSSKIGTAGHFGIKANTAMRTSWADNKRSISRSPLGSPKQSPQLFRKSSNTDDFGMMPPPQEIPTRRKKSKQKNTPIDNISNNSNQDISRADSDPMLSKSEVGMNPPVHQSTSYTSFV